MNIYYKFIIFALSLSFIIFGNINIVRAQYDLDNLNTDDRFEENNDENNYETPSMDQDVETLQEYYTGNVISIEKKTDPQTGVEGKIYHAKVTLTSGERKGEEVIVSWIPATEEIDSFKLNEKDKIILQYTKVDNMENWSVLDKQRMSVIWVLLLLFIVCVLVVSKKYGLKALIGLAITIIVILYFLIPQIVKGVDPVFISVVSILFFIIPTLIFSHGANQKTYVAITGILFSVVLVAVLAKLSIGWAELTGINTEETFYLNLGDVKIDLINLLLAGIILGTVGIMDDLALTQSAVALEIKKTQPALKWLEVFKKSMTVGHDHISAAINTLFLAYVGISLPLVVLLTQQDIPFIIAIQREFVATEIIRTLVGSIGLVLTVPLTTFIASYIFDKRSDN